MPYSIIPYFGGKWKMSNYLASLLDTSKPIFVEAFGGACRTLLNSPTFEKEIYIEYSPYMASLIRVLTNENTSKEFIRRLQDITYSEEAFNSYLSIKQAYESDDVRLFYYDFKNYLDKLDKKYGIELRKELEKQIIYIIPGHLGQLGQLGDDERALRCRLRFTPEQLGGLTKKQVEKVLEFVSQINLCLDAYFYNDSPERFFAVEDATSRRKRRKLKLLNQPMDFVDFISQEIERWDDRYSKKYSLSKDELNNNSLYKKRRAKKARKLVLREYINLLVQGVKVINDSVYTDIDLAVTAYVVFRMSRGGMGKCFSSGRDDKDYKRSILNLDKAIQRLQGVEVVQGDSFKYIEEWKRQKRTDLMVFLDPPYLPQAKYIDSIEDIDLDEDLPGDHYDVVWTRQTHENFLKLICDVKFSALVCNYTDNYNLYDNYLTEERGWKKRVFTTKTTVSDKADNFRDECVWINY